MVRAPPAHRRAGGASTSEEELMRRISSVLIVAGVCGCGTDTTVVPLPERSPPLASLAHDGPEIVYEIIKLPPNTGTLSRGAGINGQGSVAGYSDLDTGARHAALWRHGVLEDLGTLSDARDANSNVQWPGINDNGMIVGISHTAKKDTLGETWSCAAFMAFKGYTCVGFIWDGGRMQALPTFGGDNGFATGVNNRGQVVGWAETRERSTTCNPPQKLNFLAAIWERKQGTMRALRPVEGDVATAATGINDRGEVVGISGDCDVAVGRKSARYAVLWDKKGNPHILGNLGGAYWHTPNAINDNGDVVGFSNPPGGTADNFIPHAFLWTKERGIEDLKTLDGDATSQARGINARRQVVGVSSGPGGSRAFLWEDGKIKDLNAMVEPGFPDRLISAQGITNDGRITGALVEKSSGKTLAYIATPRRREH
jgi:probable HAF family extracellular repeat protein